MGLKRVIFSSIFSFSIVFNSFASDIPTNEEVQKALKPILAQGKVVSVSKSPIPNLYEVVVEANGRFFPIYMDKSLRYVISGMIVDLKTRENITQKKFIKLQMEAEKKKFVALVKALGNEKANKLAKLLAGRKYSIVDLPSIPDNAIVLGNPNGKKVLYVITDPECPFCKQFDMELKKLVEMDKDVKIVEILYPLPFHRHAFQVSSAVLCQDSNEKSKELLDKAFANQRDSSTLENISKQACPKGDFLVKQHKSFASKVGLTGTPTILIPLKNGKAIVVSGGFGVDTLKEILEIVYK